TCALSIYFPATVGPEIEAYYRIARFNEPSSGDILLFNNGLYKFVGNICRIGGFYRLNDIVGLLALSVYKRVVSQLNPFPPFVPVHGIIAPGNRRYFAGGLGKVLLQVFNKAQSAFRVGIAAVGKSMNENIIQLLVLADACNGFQMVDMRMNPAI